MRAQPDMTIIAPADPPQAVTAVHRSRAVAGPIYFRIGKTSASIPGLDGRFEIGALDRLSSGNDLRGLSARALTESIATELSRAHV